MNDLSNIEAFATAKPFASAVVDPNHHGVIGFELNGANAGPTILIAGLSPLLEAVFDRLAALPTLPWMRGRIRMHILHHGQTDPSLPDEIVDEVLYLPGMVVADLSEEAIKDSYLATLRLATKLGMIQGRGVSPAR